MSDTRAWLDEQQAYADAATKGPWRVQVGLGEACVENGRVSIGREHTSSDAAFIAAARTGYPKALDAIRAVLELTDIGSLAMPDGKDPYWVSHVRNAIDEHLEDR